MAALISLLIIVTISYLCVRAGAVALMLTGLSAEAASFQSQSAFMGVGFTTNESESVVGHPVRRRVIRLEMLVGYAAMASVFASIMSVFSVAEEAGPAETGKVTLYILGTLLVLFVLSTMAIVRNSLTRLLEYALTRSGAVQVRDYEELLRVDKGFSISYLPVENQSWMAGKTLRQLRLTDEGVLVLNILRVGGVTLTTPGADTRLDPGDKLLCYGLEHDLAQLASRPADYKGESEHQIATHLHQVRQTAEETVDTELSEVVESVKELDQKTSNPPRPE